MSGVSIVIEIGDLQPALDLVTRLAAADATQLLSDIGALGESQTRARISAGGPAPDGSAWAPNIEGNPILRRTGRNLLDSVAFAVSGAEAVEWGAAWEFAHVHQFGATIRAKDGGRLAFFLGGRMVRPKQVTIPARPFVGLSADDAAEIEEYATDFLRSLAQ